jgi:hypothetical protein
MVIQTWQLFLILFVFFGGGAWLIIFLYRFKFSKIQKVARSLGWVSSLGQANIPAEIVEYGNDVRRFSWFEWVISGEVQGKKVYFAQYFLSGSTQYPYRYVAFSLFENPISVPDVDHEYGANFKQIFGNSGDFSLTERGIFFYHATLWEMNTKNILSVAEKLVAVRNCIEKK